MPQESIQRISVLAEESSPRSTIPLASDRMVGTADSNATNKNGSSTGETHTVAPEEEDTLTATTTTQLESSVDAVTPTIEKEVVDAVEGGPPLGTSQKQDDMVPPMTPLPQVDYSYGTYATPRSAPYYGAYSMTPEPASPATHGTVYDVSSFLQQQHLYPNSPFLNATASPARSGLAHGVIPPASPLFPRVNSADSTQAPPVLPYMVSPAHPQQTTTYNPTANTPEETASWTMSSGERPPGYPAANASPYSFHPRRTARPMEDTMLPPAALEDPGNPAYSPYGGSQASYSMQIPPWPYGAGDPYNAAPSPLQPRPMYRPMYSNTAAGGGYYANNHSPGPPIQTTASNKGPDGANLFIFHIPNNFTNMDMYHLFQPYGNLLSVRIMIEKESGRSRGFGFVSYDSPESAALAIKELNGYTIGNKRLKVQHKQIRRQDVSDREHPHGSFSSMDGYGPQPPPPPSGGNFPTTSSMPSSGPGASHIWYDKTGQGTEALSNLGAMRDALPEIPGTVVEEDRTAVA